MTQGNSYDPNQEETRSGNNEFDNSFEQDEQEEEMYFFGDEDDDDESDNSTVGYSPAPTVVNVPLPSIAPDDIDASSGGQSPAPAPVSPIAPTPAPFTPSNASVAPVDRPVVPLAGEEGGASVPVSSSSTASSASSPVLTADSPAVSVADLSNLEVIFSSLFSLDAGAVVRKQEFLAQMSGIDLFRDEFLVFYTLVKEHTKIAANEKFLRLYLATNRSAFVKHKHIDYSKYEMADQEDVYVSFVASCVDLFTECAKRTVTEVDFERSVVMHRMQYISAQAISILERGAHILTDGITERGRTLSGYEDMRGEVSKGMVSLDNLAIKSGHRGIITHDMLEDDDDEANKLQPVGKLGIEAADAHLGAIYEGDMVSLLAPSKGGKSRISTQALHRTMVEMGNNIAMWSVENGPLGFRALIRAHHFDYYYNRNSDGKNRKIINSDMIRTGVIPPDIKDLERASWADFRHNEKHGKLTLIDQEFHIDTYMDHIRRAVEVAGVKFICIDYLQMIGSGKTNMPKQERIAQAYQETLQYLKANRIGGIFPAQLKQSAVGALSSSTPEDLLNAELRDSAGESYEVIKTPDVNLVLFGTAETMSQGEMTLLSIPSRNVSPFDPIQMHVDLGTCTFTSIKGESLVSARG